MKEDPYQIPESNIDGNIKRTGQSIRYYYTFAGGVIFVFISTVYVYLIRPFGLSELASSVIGGVLFSLVSSLHVFVHRLNNRPLLLLFGCMACYLLHKLYRVYLL